MGMERDPLMPNLDASCCKSRSSAAKVSAEYHEVHFVHRGHDVPGAQQRGDVGVTADCVRMPLRVHEDDGHVGG